MNVELLVISCAKHFSHLQYALRSIQKFARGFSACRVVIPRQDIPAMDSMVFVFPPDFKDGFPIVVDGFDEWPNQGMLHHMHIIMHADQYCPDADIIMHFDSDWVFTKPVTPQDFLVEGKPLIMYGSFDWLVNQVQGNLKMWQDATENAIGKPVPIETMRWPRLLFWRDLYPMARREIEMWTGKNMVEFMRAQRNEFPQTFCEYVTLGNVAWRYHREKYFWRDQKTHGFPEPWKVHQAWSHEPPTAANLEFYRKLGIA